MTVPREGCGTSAAPTRPNGVDDLPLACYPDGAAVSRKQRGRPPPVRETGDRVITLAVRRCVLRSGCLRGRRGPRRRR